MSSSTEKPKILIFDIETRPAKSYHWRMFKENISVEQLIEPSSILCVGMKWFGESTVEVVSVWDMSEEEMLRYVHSKIMEADAVVGKNSIKFDLPHLKTWFLKYDLDPLPALTHVDLEKVARWNFKFQSNKLEYIVEFLELGHKMDTNGFKLWKEVMEGDERAQAKMKRYCARDVRITDKLYRRMRGWISDHPALRSIGSEACPACGGRKTKKDGVRYTKCYHIQRHKCLNPKCRSWFSGKKTKVA